MRTIACLTVVLAGALCSAGAAGADTDINFETPSVANCASVAIQYSGSGIVFVSAAPESIGSLSMPSALVVNAAAHSSSHVLLNGGCSDEFPYPQEVFQVLQTRAAVSAFVRSPDDTFSLPVQLRAYDAGGARIDTNGASYTTLVGGTGSPWTQISAATSDNTNRIATVALVTPNPILSQGLHVWMDDIHLTDGVGGTPADFTLGPSPTIVVQQGHTASTFIPVNRLNGSTGAITLATSGSPHGMGASAAPAGDNSAAVYVSADLDAPPGAQSFTLTGTPSSASAGPQARSATIPVFVQPTLPTITISDPAEGTLLDRVPYDPVARGTFNSPRGGGHVCTVVTHTADAPAPPPAASCTGVVSGGGGSWFHGIDGLTPGANYITAFIRDNSGYIGSATRLLRIADETTGIDLRITGVQVTQDVQEASGGLLVPSASGTVAYHGVQLVQGKPIYVRVFADTNRAARSDGRTPSVTARLRVIRRGSEVPFSPFMPLPFARDLLVGGLYASYGEMSDFGQGYRFALSSSLSTTGPLTLEATVNDGLTTPIIECAMCRANDTLRITDLRFRPEHTRDIYPMEFHDTVDGARRVSGTPSQIFALAQQIYPFPVAVHPWVASIDITAALGEAARDIASHPDDRAENWVTHFPGDYERDHNPDGPVIAVAAPGSYPGGMETSAFFCCLPPRIDPFAVTLENRPLTSVAHEFGHTEGLAHADHTCGGNADGQVSDDGWPDPNGTLVGIGFDGLGGRVLPAYVTGSDGRSVASNFDFMSYCARENSAWISTRNWNILVDHEAAGSASRVASTRALPPKGPSGSGLAVSAVLPFAGGTGAVTDVQPVSGGAQGSDPGGDTTLVVLGTDGAAVSSTTVTSTLVHSDVAGTLPQLQVSAVVPAGSDPRALQVRRGGAILASRTASAHAPSVRLLAPRRGARVGTSLLVRWGATDADGDRLTFAVDEATGPRAPFRMVTAGVTGSQTTIPLSLLTPSTSARIRVRALDGFRQGSAVVAGVRIPAGAPQVAIAQPVRATTTLRADGVVALEGQAFDAHSRRLSGKALTWRLDRRRVATGPSAQIGELVPGHHTLTLTAVGDGKRGSASRTLVVTKVTPRVLTATAAKLSRRARSVTLQLAASVRCRVRISGGARAVSVTIDRRAVSVHVPVKPGAKALALVLALRGGGGSATAKLSVVRG